MSCIQFLHAYMKFKYYRTCKENKQLFKLEIYTKLNFFCACHFDSIVLPKKYNINLRKICIISCVFWKSFFNTADGKISYSLSDFGRSKDVNLRKVNLPDGLLFL